MYVCTYDYVMIYCTDIRNSPGSCYKVIFGYRNIANLLEDIVFFVIKKETSSDRKDPLTEEGKPDRDRQKLLREQYVLKHVRKDIRTEICYLTYIYRFSVSFVTYLIQANVVRLQMTFANNNGAYSYLIVQFQTN